MFVSQHNTFKQPSANPVSHDTCTRELPPAFVTRATEQAKNEQRRSQRSTLRNSLPGIGFHWGHCQVLFVSQHNTFKQPSANPVSHDTCTRELPPAFVTRATEQAKNEQRRSQRSTLRNSLPGIGFRWGHCQVLFVSQHNTFKQPSANPVSHDTCTRELPPAFVTRATEQAKNEQRRSQRSTLRNSLPGIGFRWGHCQVLFVSQHNTFKQPSANPVSHDTCTRELPPAFVTRVTEQAKNEQRRSQRSTLRNSLPGIGFHWGHCQVLFVSQHNTFKQPSANPVSHDTCTRELPPAFVTRATEQAKNEQRRSQRSTLRNSLPGIGFRWGHCQVLFVSQHNTFKQPSANPVSHDTCTRELPPAFVTRATEQAKNEQRRSQRSTLRNSLPGIGFRWGHCQVLFVSQHNTFKQPSANPVSHDTCTRELPPAFVTRATEQAKNEQRRSQRSTLRNSLPGIGFRWGHCQVLFVSQHNTFKQPSANPVSHDTCTRELPPAFVTRATEQAKNEQRRSQRSTLRNSLPGIGFRWGHCQVLFVSQHNTFKQPSANPVSHDTCTRELPPAFVTRATEQAKNEQRRSQRSTLRNSLPGIGFRWGHCQVLFVSQHNTFKQPSANPVSHDTCTRELPPAFVTRATEQAKNEQRRSQRSTLRNSLPGIGFRWGHCQVLFVSQRNTLQATIGESSLSRHLHTRIAARVCDTSGRAGEK